MHQAKRWRLGSGFGVGMSEIRTVTTLRSMQRDIKNAIAGYEKHIQQSRADLAAINAAIAIFEATGHREGYSLHRRVRLFARGESVAIAFRCLRGGAADHACLPQLRS